MAYSWLHEDDGRNLGPRRELIDAAERLAERIYFGALVVRVVRAIDTHDTSEMLVLLSFVQKGDLQGMVILNVDLIDAYCRATGATFEEVRRVLRA